MLRPYLPLWRLAYAVCVASVLVLSLMPAPPEALSTGWDKTNHLLAFSSIMFLGYYAFPKKTFMVVVTSIAIGALIEVLQSFTAYRTAEWGDLLADALGVMLGGLVIVVTRKWIAKFITAQPR